MLRSGMIALRLGRKTTERCSCPLHSIVLLKTFTSKDEAKSPTKDASRIAKDAGRIAQDSSKKLAQAFEGLSSSNEVKLVRLTAKKACKVGKELIEKHVVKNPQFQQLLLSLRKKLDEIPIATTEVKSKLAKKAKEVEAKASNLSVAIKNKGDGKAGDKQKK